MDDLSWIEDDEEIDAELGSVLIEVPEGEEPPEPGLITTAPSNSSGSMPTNGPTSPPDSTSPSSQPCS